MSSELRTKLVTAEETVEINKQECFVDAGWTPYRDRLATEMAVALKLMSKADLEAEAAYAAVARERAKRAHPDNRFAGFGWEAYRSRVYLELARFGQHPEGSD